MAQREERSPGLLERVARTLAVGSPEMFMTAASAPSVEQDEATIVTMTERVIAEAAALGRVVLVGRGAQAVLAQRPDALHVYVVASRPWRMKLAVERLGVDVANAGKVVDETDRRRDDYVVPTTAAPARSVDYYLRKRGEAGVRGSGDLSWGRRGDGMEITLQDCALGERGRACVSLYF